MFSFQPDVIPHHHSSKDVLDVLKKLNFNKEYGKALSLCRIALNRFPENESIFLDFCLALERCGMKHDALRALRLGLQKNSKSPALHGSLVEMLFRVGDASAMLEELNKFLLKVNRGDIPKSTIRNTEIALSNISALCLYRDDISDQQKWRIHKDTGDAVLRKSATRQNNKSHFNSKPRIGFLSNQINKHAVGKFAIPFLRCVDFGKYDLYVYFDTHGTTEVAYQDSVAALSDTPISFRRIDSGKIGAAFDMIRDDSIDILMDFSGRFSGGPLNLLALKPAPIQASWIGYPTHPGLKTIDFMLSDRFCEPSSDLSEGEGVGKIYHFDRFFSCFEGPNVPSHFSPPSLDTGFITFGSFNNIAKISHRTVEIWSAVLRLVPNSKLLLKFYSFLPHQREALLGEFEKCGIVRGRVHFEEAAENYADHLRFYNSIDVALDTFPYNGTTTTCEALWMGTPVLTILGSSHCSRVSAGILHSIGCSELISENDESFAAMATKLANDKDRLHFYKKNIRSMMEKSELCDASSMARHFGKFVDFATTYMTELQDKATVSVGRKR
jgi:protein O-GlcNAc transferase